ncbi:tellurite resistance TerB family protein [Roseinatronobacter sp. NSM]|uniref:tellurite resistance TerB family protein n=1 Tax=Roseinatronobacter sp. NSM TaxID=3457785 RepID=UPI004034F970
MLNIVKNLLQSLTAGADRPAPSIPDGKHALAALLVRAARASEVYDDRQIAQIDAILARRFTMSLQEADALRLRGAALEARAGDTVHLTRPIKDLVALEDRPALLEDLWRVILADGGRHDNEDGLMRLVSNLLGLADRQSAFARQYVMTRENALQPDHSPLAR